MQEARFKMFHRLATPKHIIPAVSCEAFWRSMDSHHSHSPCTGEPCVRPPEFLHFRIFTFPNYALFTTYYPLRAELVTIAIACAAIPSSLPIAPIFSTVVALTDTQSTGIPAYSAKIFLISSI